ncbi:MAG TPA: ATP-binding protein [candidate division Zixibacteria bacterium]|nr:ATP-binding protein [candidate division Zixibacteria bacterium]
MKSQPEPVLHRVAGQHVPISTRLLTAFSVCALLGAFAIGYILHASYKARLQQAHELLINMGDEKLRVIDLWLNERKSDGDVIAQFPVIQALVSGKKSVPLAHAATVLDAFANHYDYSALYVLDKNGNVVVSSTNGAKFPKERLWSGTAPRIPLVQSLIPEDQTAPAMPSIAIVSPIWKAGDRSEPVGALVTITKPSSLASVVETSPETAGVRSIFISRTRSGRPVYLTHTRYWPPQVKNWFDAAAEPALNGETQFLTRIASDGTPQYCVTRTVPVLGWGMVTRIDRSQVDRPFFIAVTLSAGLFVVVVGMLAFIVIAMWRQQQVHVLQREMARRFEIEEKLRQSEERWKKAFRSSPEAIGISTLKEGRFVEVNDKFLTMHGFNSRDQVLGKTSRDLNLWVSFEERDRVMQELRRTGRFEGGPFRLRTTDGRIVDLETSAETMQLAGEDCVMMLGRDVTAQRQLEEQYRQSQKMEAVGRLAGGIAHDFNNMLAVISLSCELLLEEQGPESPIGRRLAVVRNATERAAGLTRQLLAFSRRQVLQPQVTDLSAIVVDTKKMLERVIGEDVEICLNLWKDPCPILADAGQMVQILMNLAVNSRDAMPEGGKLTLTTRIAMLPPTVIHEGYQHKPHVLLSVSDTGVGIDPQLQERIFEPFFTTKRDGKGTGLGLATVYGIVKQSNGCIQLESQVGRGTTFHIYLPLANAASGATGEERTVEQQRGHGRVLLVEDEADIRELARQALESSGYHVETAADGAEALSKFESSESCDLLITDITMPRISGEVLVSTLRERGVCPRVLYISAYSEKTIAPDDGSSLEFLQKPFTRQDLLGKVQSILGFAQRNAGSRRAE